jgi:hypothetical protein
MDQYEKMSGNKPNKYTLPLEKSAHPEIDTTDKLDQAGIKIYQSMIFSLQWAISLGQYDIQTATMTISRFRAAARKNHHERLKDIYGYLRQFKSAAIQGRVNKPEFSTLPVQEFKTETVYGMVQEEIPKDITEPHGKPVVSVHDVDDNLYHNIIAGHSATGILHLCKSFSKPQACVQTSKNLLLQGLLWIRLWICRIFCVTLEFQSRNGASYLETTKLW